MRPGDILGIDHFVLTVADSGRTAQFYGEILGMEIITFDEGRMALRLGNQKINIHVAGQERKPHAVKPVPGSGDFCLITTRPVAELVPELESRGVAVEHGPVRQAGATEPLLSIYFRDPDGNLVELANTIA